MPIPLQTATYPESVPLGKLQRLVRLLDESLSTLGARATPAQLEEWSVIVHEAMSGRGRSFHNVEHVFDLAIGAPAAQAVAAFFHDVVYFQVDGGLPPKLDDLLGSALELEQGAARLRPVPAGSDAPRALVLAIFGLKARQLLLPQSGLNEFLSALLVARLLSGLLPLATVAQLVACVEATIAFREADTADAVAEALATRLERANRAFALGMSPAQLEAAMRDAVALANRDVANFAADDPGEFLANTWKLLPETNATLRARDAYTISEYRVAMQKMELFLASLPPERVFRSWRGTPSAEELDHLLSRTRRNLSIAPRYLRAKLVAASLLEALAEATGGDAPIALFMGDLPEGDRPMARLERHLPPPTGAPAEDADALVLRLLQEGRASHSGFDIANAPLAAYLYRALGDSGSQRALAASRDAARAGRSRGLLAALPRPMIATVARACAHLAITRTHLLDTLAASFD